MNKRSTIKMFAVGTIVAIIISSLGLGVNIYAQFPKADPGMCVTKTSGTVEYLKQGKDSSKTYDTIKMQPCKGQYYVTLYQDKGKNGTKYTVYAKKSSEKKYKKYKTISLKNGVESSKVKMFYTKNNTSTYYVKIVKENYNRTYSRVKQTIRVY